MRRHKPRRGDEDDVPDAGRRVGDTRTVCDLTHVLRQGFPVARYSPPRRSALASIPVEGFRSNQWSLVEHTATHVDAPSHFAATGADVSRLAPTDLIVAIAVIDVSSRVVADPDTAVTVADLERYENAFGPLPGRAGVFMHSGWDRRASNATSYLGDDGRHQSPGFSVEAANWLLENRQVTCIGVDSPSIDVGSSTTLPVHHRWLGSGKYAVEGLAHLSAVPPAGATAFIGVVPLEGGTGGPCRVLAVW
jgi:kynurenine formamidase